MNWKTGKNFVKTAAAVFLAATFAAPLGIHKSRLFAESMQQKKKRLKTKYRRRLQGKMHLQKLEKIVVFNRKPNLKNPDPKTIVTTILPGKTYYIVGFFSKTIGQTGGVPSLVFHDSNKKNDYRVRYVQPMYFSLREKKSLRRQLHYVFELFPNPKKVRYKSPIKYHPSMNIARFFSTLKDDTYDIKFVWGRNTAMATSPSIRFDMRNGGQKKMKDYYAQLVKKRLSVMRINLTGRECRDQRRKISNLRKIRKYGKIVHLALSKKRYSVRCPFPRRHRICYYRKVGYASMKRSDGKIELISMAFKKRVRERKWRFTNLQTSNRDLQFTAPVHKKIKPENLGRGYEISRKNARKCSLWH